MRDLSAWRFREKANTATAGFTLIELAVMLVIMGLVLSGGFKAILVQTTKRQAEQTQTAMQEIQRALLGFITVNGRLPYPAKPSSADGVEDNTLLVGLVPWNTLGIRPVDAWGRAFTYHVTGAFADETTFVAATGGLTVQAANGVDLVADSVPCIMVSHGPNGRGAYLSNGTQLSTSGSVAAELENTNGDLTYRIAGDDILLWIPTDVLKYQRSRSYSPP